MRCLSRLSEPSCPQVGHACPLWEHVANDPAVPCLSRSLSVTVTRSLRRTVRSPFPIRLKNRVHLFWIIMSVLALTARAAQLPVATTLALHSAPRICILVPVGPPDCVPFIRGPRAQSITHHGPFRLKTGALGVSQSRSACRLSAEIPRAHTVRPKLTPFLRAGDPSLRDIRRASSVTAHGDRQYHSRGQAGQLRKLLHASIRVAGS